VAGEVPFRSFNRYPPPGVDARAPNIARVYNAFLGGKDNFAADRQVVESVLRVAPDAANSPAKSSSKRTIRSITQSNTPPNKTISRSTKKKPISAACCTTRPSPR